MSQALSQPAPLRTVANERRSGLDLLNEAVSLVPKHRIRKLMDIRNETAVTAPTQDQMAEYKLIAAFIDGKFDEWMDQLNAKPAA